MSGKLIVSDSGPLISMMKIARLDLLQEMFGEVVVPRTVYEKVTRNKDFPSEKKMIEESPFITAADVKDMDAVQALMKREKIHRGEAEAILLVEEQFGKEETSLLVDDGDARLVATREGVHIIGTIGALGKAFREGRVTKEEMAQYADIFESTRRRYSENELNSLRHPDSSAPSKDNLDKLAKSYNSDYAQ